MWLLTRCRIRCCPWNVWRPFGMPLWASFLRGGGQSWSNVINGYTEKKSFEDYLRDRRFNWGTMIKMHVYIGLKEVLLKQVAIIRATPNWFPVSCPLIHCTGMRAGGKSQYFISFPKFMFLGLYAFTNYNALVKVSQEETVISHVKNSLGQDRSGATSIIDARADQHVCSCLFSLTTLSRDRANPYLTSAKFVCVNALISISIYRFTVHKTKKQNK